MFLIWGAVAFIVVLSCCIDSVGIPEIPDAQMERFIAWRERCVSWRGVAALIDRILQP